MAYHQLRIAKIVQETPDARSFVLEVPADIADKFSYRAGQFLTFQVPHESGAFNRCYSLSSAPETDGKHLKVTVKRVAGGKDQVLRSGQPRRELLCPVTRRKPARLEDAGAFSVHLLVHMLVRRASTGHAHPASKEGVRVYRSSDKGGGERRAADVAMTEEEESHHAPRLAEHAWHRGGCGAPLCWVSCTGTDKAG